MATTVMKAADIGIWRLPSCVVLGTLLLAIPRVEALEFEPRITIGVTRTDNVRIEADDGESQTIYRAEPAFSLRHDSQRINFNADYLMQAFRYADLGQSEVYHQYNASLRGAVVPEILFLEVGGDRTQSILDPEGRIPQSNLPLSGNRTDRDEYYVEPSFQYALGGAITAQARYRNSWVDFRARDALGAERGSENRTASFSLDNYRRGTGLTTAVRYDWQRTEYDDDGIPWEFQQATLELGFWLSGTTRIFASGGKESAWDMPLDPALEDSFWEAGFAHQVGERLSAEFAIGERTFGSSWRGSLQFDFLRGSTSLSYSETPTTEDRTRFRSSGFRDEIDLEDFLSRPGRDDRFIDKRLEWRFNYSLQRTDFAIGLFDGERSQRTSSSGEPLGDESQRGADVSVNYRLGARTDLRARGSISEREFQENDKSRLIRASVAADYQLGSRTSIALEYEYSEEDGDSDSFARDYTANTVSLSLTRTF